MKRHIPQFQISHLFSRSAERSELLIELGREAPSLDSNACAAQADANLDQGLYIYIYMSPESEPAQGQRPTNHATKREQYTESSVLTARLDRLLTLERLTET